MNSYLPVIDCLITPIKHRLDAYRLLCTGFGFLSDILNMSNEQLRKSASYLRECYPDDLEESTPSEFIQFAAMKKNIIPAVGDNTFESSCSLELKMFTLIHENNLVD